jgi:hypothetical protein
MGDTVMQGFGRKQRQQMAVWAGGGTPTGQLSATPKACLSTSTIADDGSGITEPTIGTGAYAAAAIAWTAPPLPTAGNPVVLGNSATITWGPSTGSGFSPTGPFTVIGVYDHATTRTEAVFLGAAGVSVARSVAAAGITLESLAGDLQFTLTPT